jgi:hypothetical protein
MESVIEPNVNKKLFNFVDLYLQVNQFSDET